MDDYNAQIHNLMEKARGCYTKAQKSNDLVVEEKRAFTTEERANYDGWIKEGDEFKAQADEMLQTTKRKSVLQSRMDELKDTPIFDIETGVRSFEKTATKADRMEVEKKAISHYVRYGNFNDAPEEVKALTRLSGPDGGFLVMEEFRNEISVRLRDLVWMRQDATVIQTSQAAISYPTWDYDHTVAKRSDNAAVAVDDITNAAGRDKFTPHSFGSIVKIPEELLDDTGFDFFNFLTGDIASRWTELEETQYITGTGSQAPLGLLESGLGATDVETATSAEITVNDIQKLPYKITAVHRQNGRWMMNRTYVEKAMLLRTDDGGAGTGRFMWQPSFTAGQPATLAGYPVRETEFWETVSADGDAVAVFGNFKKYVIVEKTGSPSIVRLNELYAGNNQVGIKFTARIDGGVVSTDAFRRLNRT